MQNKYYKGTIIVSAQNDAESLLKYLLDRKLIFCGFISQVTCGYMLDESAQTMPVCGLDVITVADNKAWILEALKDYGIEEHAIVNFCSVDETFILHGSKLLDAALLRT